MKSNRQYKIVHNPMDQSVILAWSNPEKFSTIMIYHLTGQLVQLISDYTTTRIVI